MSSVDRAQSYVLDFSGRHGIGGYMQRVLGLILEELITNTVRHGQPPADSRIRIALTVQGEDARLRYRDQGIAFDPLKDLPPPDFSQTVTRRRVGGMGWPLILYYCASAHYARDGDANVIDLVMPILDAPVDRDLKI